uniref:Uncharacterized protein n=1 Tax=Romanomermis culicivorax TaxID=13658 RepID=A0A915JET7_ROMCU
MCDNGTEEAHREFSLTHLGGAQKINSTTKNDKFLLEDRKDQNQYIPLISIPCNIPCNMQSAIVIFAILAFISSPFAGK